MVTTLRRLAAALGCRVIGPDVEVSGVALDSRCVVQGDLFAALKGRDHEGARFIAEAERRGAVAVLVDAACPVDTALPLLLSDRPRADASRAAHLLAGDPGAGLELFGVTGTNGKTTTCWLLKHLLEPEPDAYGCLGTVSFRTAGVDRRSTHTTPDPVSMSKLLRGARGSGQAGCILEVSSHALHQERLAGLWFSGVVFTNLTRDHLDYHGSMERYRDAKLRLVTQLGPAAPVVFPADDEWLAPALRDRGDGISFGRSADAWLRITAERHHGAGARIRLAWDGQEVEVHSPLLGPFNVSNVAAAFTLGVSLGRDPEELVQRVACFAGVPGRMERITGQGAPLVVVDYAHAPDAVEKAVDACRHACAGRLIVVVGAGGDRDRGKRPLMGAAAQRRADLVIVTSDNPRGEDPSQIMEDVSRGFEPGGCPWMQEPDRATAIRLAIQEARSTDCVAILGKGHEDYQEVAGVRRRFVDAEVARQFLSEDVHG